MPVETVGPHIEIVQGAGGPKAVVAGHRIRVQDVAIWYEKMGMTADEIVLAYPTLTKAEVFAALSYYWDHRDEIEREIAEGDAFAEMLRGKTPSQLGARLRRLIAGE